MRNKYSIETIKSFIFGDNWLEPPYYYNNLGKVLRFDLIGKSEQDTYRLINNCLSDLFINESYMYVIFYCTKSISWNKRYFYPFTMRKIFKKKYTSKVDEDKNEENPYVVVGLTKRKYFKDKKYFGEYLRGERTCAMAFLSCKKKAAVHFYDSRGFDLFSDNLDFLKGEYSRYKEYIIESDKNEIIKSLSIEDC